MGQKLDAARADLDRAREELEIRSVSLDAARQETERLTTQHVNMCAKNKALRADLDRAREDLEQLQAQYATTEKQRDYWISATHDARTKCAELQGDKDYLRSELAEARNDLEVAARNYEALEDVNAELRDDRSNSPAAVVTSDDWFNSDTRVEIPSTEYQNLKAKADTVETLKADLDHARAENDRRSTKSAKMFATVKELRDDLVYLGGISVIPERRASTLDRELAQERLQHNQTMADLAKLQEQLLASDNTQHQHTAGDCVPRAKHEALRQSAKSWEVAYRQSAGNAQKARIKRARAERKHAASKRKHKGAEARAHKLTKELNTVLHTLETERSNLRVTAAQRDRYRERLAKAEREATETRANGRKRETYVVSTFGQPDRFETVETGTVADLRLGDRGRLATIETRDGRTYKGHVGDITYGIDPANKDAGLIVGIGLNTETGTNGGGAFVDPEDKLIIHTTTAEAVRKQAEQALADCIKGLRI